MKRTLMLIILICLLACVGAYYLFTQSDDFIYKNLLNETSVDCEELIQYFHNNSDMFAKLEINMETCDADQFSIGRQLNDETELIYSINNKIVSSDEFCEWIPEVHQYGDQLKYDSNFPFSWIEKEGDAIILKTPTYFSDNYSGWGVSVSIVKNSTYIYDSYQPINNGWYVGVKIYAPT